MAVHTSSTTLSTQLQGEAHGLRHNAHHGHHSANNHKSNHAHPSGRSEPIMDNSHLAAALGQKQQEEQVDPVSVISYGGGVDPLLQGILSHPHSNYSNGGLSPPYHILEYNLTDPAVATTMNANDSDYLDDYIYDYDASVNTFPLEELVPVVVVYSLTLLLGVVGNALVIFSIARYRRMQTVTNIFLTSLSSADLLLVLLCVPIKLAKWLTFTWEFGEVLCKLVHYMQNVSVICSVLTLTSMSLERYYAILHPMKAKFTCTVKRARRAIICVWISSFVLAIPIIKGQVHKEVGVRIKAHWCVKEWELALYSQFYEVCMLLLIFVIPLFIISFAYVNICIELWVMASRRAHMRAGNDANHERYVDQGSEINRGRSGPIRLRRRRKPQADDDRTRKQVIKMLVTVIALFAVCWGPSLIDNVLVAFGLVEKYNYDHLKHIRQAFALMSYANSCVNPIVYAFMSKNFRDSFKHAICACVVGERYLKARRRQRQVSFQTRSMSLSTQGQSLLIRPTEITHERVLMAMEAHDPVGTNSGGKKGGITCALLNMDRGGKRRGSTSPDGIGHGMGLYNTKMDIDENNDSSPVDGETSM